MISRIARIECRAGLRPPAVHSVYSLLEGALTKIARLAEPAKSDRQPRFALTVPTHVR